VIAACSGWQSYLKLLGSESTILNGCTTLVDRGHVKYVRGFWSQVLDGELRVLGDECCRITVDAPWKNNAENISERGAG
jgi:hypothetical protein